MAGPGGRTWWQAEDRRGILRYNVGAVRTCTLLVGLVLSVAVRATGQAVLILPFENRTSSSALEWLGESAASGIASRWRSLERYAIRREERLAALDQLGIPAAVGISHATVIKIGEATGADFIITGSYEGDASRLIFTARVLEMKQPRMDRPCAETGPLTELLALQERLGIALLKSAGLVSAPGTGLGSASLEGWENYIRGVLAGPVQTQLKYFRESARLDPAFRPAAFQLGKIAFQAQDYPTAVLWLSKLSAGDAGYLEASFFIGLSAYHLREWEKAEAYFRSVTDILPLNEAFNNLGVVQSRQRKRGAAESFQKAIEGDAADPDYSFNLALLYMRLGDFSQASRRLRETIAKKPGDTEARALLNAAGSESMPAEIQDRVKYNFEEPGYRQLRMTLERALEDKLESRPEPSGAGSHVQKGRELFDRGDDTSAISEFREAVKLAPGDAQAFLYLARLYLRGGRIEEAVDSARRASELGKKDSAPLLLLARIYWDQGKAGEAREAVREALDRDPNNGAAREMERTMKARPQ